MNGGSKPAGSTTQTTEPWEGVQPYLKDIYARVGGGSRPTMPVAPGGIAGGGGVVGGGGAMPQDHPLAGFDFRIEEDRPRYAGVAPRQPVARVPTGGGGGVETVPGLIDEPIPIFDPVGFTAPERIAQRRLLDIARSDTPGAVGAATGEMERTLGGGYLDEGNPYLAAMVEASARPVRESFMEETLPALTSQFAGAGRRGSGMHESVALDATEDLNRALADASAGVYGKAYESERDRMLRSMALAPQISTLERDIDLQNAQLLGGVGSARREMMEARNAAETARAREPWERMQMAAQLYGAGSPFTTQSQPFYQNRLAGGLGGALSGGGLGYMLGPALGATGPVGAGVGALGGLVLGGLL